MSALATAHAAIGLTRLAIAEQAIPVIRNELLASV
jgi:hypothetical protein